jgi:hypothetical protein
MTAMPTRSDESPPRQQDRVAEPGRAPRDELRNFETDPPLATGKDDTGAAWVDDPDINTHGSER